MACFSSIIHLSSWAFSHFNLLLKDCSIKWNKTNLAEMIIGRKKFRIVQISWSPMGKGRLRPKRGKFSNFSKNLLFKNQLNKLYNICHKPLLWFVNLKSVEKINRGTNYCVHSRLMELTNFLDLYYYIPRLYSYFTVIQY